LRRNELDLVGTIGGNELAGNGLDFYKEGIDNKGVLVTTWMNNEFLGQRPCIDIDRL